MFDSQLQFGRLEQVPERYRREAALRAQRKLARSGPAQSAPARPIAVHPLRRGVATVLRRLADAVEPSPHPSAPTHAL